MYVYVGYTKTMQNNTLSICVLSCVYICVLPGKCICLYLLQIRYLRMICVRTRITVRIYETGFVVV